MPTKRYRVAPVLLIAFALGGCAQDEPVEDDVVIADNEVPAAATPPLEDITIDRWDLDRDARVAGDEFGSWLGREGVFGRWNTTADAGLTGEELGAGLFELWDANDDSALAEDEWRAGMRAWTPAGFGYGSFAEWDLNGNNALETNEIGEGLGRTGLFSEWDRNDSSLLEEDELAEVYFDVFDANDDGFLDATEWDTGMTRWRPA